MEFLLGQKSIALGGSTDVLVDDYPVLIVVPKVFEDAAPAAHHIEPHQFRVIFVFTQSAEDTLGVLSCRIPDGGQITFTDVCLSLIHI